MTKELLELATTGALICVMQFAGIVQADVQHLIGSVGVGEEGEAFLTCSTEGGPCVRPAHLYRKREAEGCGRRRALAV